MIFNWCDLYSPLPDQSQTIRIPRVDHKPRIEWIYQTREQFHAGLTLLKPLRDRGALDYWLEHRGSMHCLVIVLWPQSDFWTL